MKNLWLVLGAMSAGISVIMGAFGAHALAEKLDAKALSVFQTAAQYQMYHSLALIAFGLWLGSQEIETSLPGWAFSVGIVLFSGSLYALALSGIKVLGAITPLGGVSFILGWLSFAWLAYRGSF